MFSWDGAPFGSPTASWPGRRYDISWLFDGPEYKEWYYLKNPKGDTVVCTIQDGCGVPQYLSYIIS